MSPWRLSPLSIKGLHLARRKRSRFTQRSPDINTFPTQYLLPAVATTVASSHAPGTDAPQHHTYKDSSKDNISYYPEKMAFTH